MRTVWIDYQQQAQDAKLKTFGITRAYFDARDTPRTTTLERGIYRVQSWENAPPDLLAVQLSNDVKRWGGDPYKQLAVHANIEIHDPAYIVAFLKAWRSRRPVRETAIALEGMQGGWFTPAMVAAINADKNLTILAEAYTGDMGLVDADATRSNLIDYGITRSKAVVFYDAAKLAQYWDGCAFTQQRLP
jgi:hypothetical protein